MEHPASSPGEEYAPNPTPAIRGGASETSVGGDGGTPESYRGISGLEEEAAQNSNTGTISDVFLQLGVFTSRENAESFRSHVSAQLVDLKVKTELVIRDGYFRIYAGPYASPTEARAAAERIGERMGIQPFIVRRD
ncbi:MAG: SPOR domain-containing protein [Betaproteobacteria bacterium]|nr:SPOR domain-containing protein [Betaproteobacteria bacterium]